MDAKKAIEFLEREIILYETDVCHEGDGTPDGDWISALRTAIRALQKDIGQKPIECVDLYPPEQFACPVCGGCVGRHKTYRKVNNLIGEMLDDCKIEYPYCLECGQKIDWSEWSK